MASVLCSQPPRYFPKDKPWLPLETESSKMGWTPLNFHPCEYTVSQALYSRMSLRFWRLKAVQWGLLLSFVANLDSLHKAHWDRASECCGMESHPVWPQSSSCGDCMGQGECSVGGMACIQLIHLCAEVAYWQSPKLASCQGNIRELHILCRAVPDVHKKKKKKAYRGLSLGWLFSNWGCCFCSLTVL